MSQVKKAKVFTIANDYYLPQVELLRSSLYESESALESQVEFQWIRLETGSESPRAWGINAHDCLGHILASVSQYSITEASTAIKSRMIQYYFAQGYDRVIYLDPDLYFYGSFFNVLTEFADADCGLTPHLLSPYGDHDQRPNEIDIMGSGTYNLGFLYVRKSPDVEKFLEWWSARLLTDCCETKLKGIFTDQKWCDLIPSFVRGTKISLDPGFNFAYWNMHERSINRDGDRLLCNGRPLTFAHFSGVIAPSTGKVSKHSSRTQDYLTKDAKSMYEEYFARLDVLRRFGKKEWSYEIRIGFTKKHLPVLFRQALNDLFRANPALIYKINSKNDVLYEICQAKNGKLPAFMTSLLSQRKDVAAEYMPSILQGNVRPLLDWIKKSGARELPGVELLPILTEEKTVAEKMVEVYAARADLQAAYPAAFASVATFLDFSHWISNSYTNEYGEKLDVTSLAYDVGVTGLLKLDFLMQLDAGFGAGLKLDAAGAAARLLAWIETDRRVFSQSEKHFLRTGLRLHPREMELRIRLRLKRICFAKQSEAWTNILSDKSDSPLLAFARRLATQTDNGFNYYSYSYACSGLGVAARQLMRVLTGENIDFRRIPLPSLLDFDKAISIEELCEAEANLHWQPSAREINFYHANFDVLDRVTLNDQCYNAAYPIWEVENAPEVIRKNISRFDVVFGACNFVRGIFDSMRPHTHLLRHAAEFPAPTPTVHIKGERKTVFAYFFDVASIPNRKNPFCVIDAFEKAFGRNSVEAGLILKVNRSEANPRFVANLISRVIDNSAIELIFDMLDEKEMDALWTRIDVYVSLHRAEGFGLTMLEAAARKKNVICTNYGGIATEFPAGTVEAIDYKMIPIGPSNAPYPVDGYWADPSSDSAAKSMLLLHKNPRKRAVQAERLETFARKYFSDKEIAKQFFAGMNAMRDKFHVADEEIQHETSELTQEAA